MKMYNYSKEFQDRVSELFENSLDIKEKLISGDGEIGFLILEIATKDISSERIIEAYENNDMKSLYLEAKRIALAIKLLKEWKSIVFKQGGEADIVKIELKLKP